MAQNTRPCKGCGQPILRTAPVAPIPHYHGAECRPRCSVDGCEKPRHGNVYCSAHHARWKRTGDPLTPLERQPNEGACTVDGCDLPMRKTRLCADHYSMLHQHGEIRDWEYKWGDGGYVSTHKWVRRRKGAPSDFACVGCGAPAEEWSYNHSDPDALRDPNHGSLYSRDVTCYEPRCVPCHRAYDKSKRTSP